MLEAGELFFNALDHPAYALSLHPAQAQLPAVGLGVDVEIAPLDHINAAIADKLAERSYLKS